MRRDTRTKVRILPIYLTGLRRHTEIEYLVFNFIDEKTNRIR